jgi:RNA polymerase sigma-70 factor (ECF subfamily)
LPSGASPLLQTEAADQRFRAPLMSFFLKRVGDRSEAEDLTQQVFLRLLSVREAERVEDPASFVFKIAANLLRDRGRRRAVSGELVSLVEEDLDRVQHEVLTPERVILGREDVRAALRVLESLGERTQTIYMLWRFDGLSQKEIAARVGCSLSLVEKTITRTTLHLLLQLGAD